jgi:hypothetical protein
MSLLLFVPLSQSVFVAFHLLGHRSIFNLKKKKNENLGNLVFEVYSLIFLCEAMKEPEQYIKGQSIV